MKIYLICPVRKCGKREKKAIEKYVSGLEAAGDKVFWADRDVEQNDDTGIGIITAERQAIKEADEIHVWWKHKPNGASKSEGSVFDFGMAWMAMLLMPGKKIRIANPEMVKAPAHKSYTTVLIVLDKCSKLSDMIITKIREVRMRITKKINP
ncbi:MAG: hypothetical protein Q8P07_02070 [bacterium]|nr:hypothetical protein [bacterium]